MDTISSLNERIIEMKSRIQRNDVSIKVINMCIAEILLCEAKMEFLNRFGE